MNLWDMTSLGAPLREEFNDRVYWRLCYGSVPSVTPVANISLVDVVDSRLMQRGLWRTLRRLRTDIHSQQAGTL